MPSFDLSPFVVVAPSLRAAEDAVTRDSIRSAKPVDLGAILSSALPAAALTRKGPLAGDVVLRGFSRDNIVFTVDNSQTFCACPNRMDPPAFHISSQQIETISVRTGPFSVDRGGSVGGSVAVQTRQASDQTFGRIYGYAGSFDYYAGGATFGAPLGDRISALGGVYYQQGGVYKDGSGVPFTRLTGTNFQPQYQDRTAFEVITAELKGTYIFGDGGKLTLNYAYQDASDVLYPGLQMDATVDTMNRITLSLSQPVAADFADEWEVSFGYSHVDHDMRDSFRNSLNNMGGAFVDRGYFMRTKATSAYASASLELRKVLAERALVRYGVDLNRRYWDANNIIAMQPNDMLPDTVSDRVGLWGVYEKRSADWAFETGVRADFARSKARDDITFVQSLLSTQTNQKDDFLPGIYALLSRDLSPSLQVYGGLGWASRLPDPQERYLNLNRPMANPDWVGNPDLDPVQTLELQGGMEWRVETFDARISAFHAWLFDHTYLVRLAAVPGVMPGGATSYENIDARIYGFSADAGWNATNSLRLEAALAWQRGVKESRPTNSTNNVLAEIPPLRARLAAIYTSGGLVAKAEGQFQADLDRIDPHLNERQLDGWAILNLSVSYQINDKWGLSAGVDNVFDKTYAVANAFVRDPFRANVIVNEPGRFWFVRAGFEF